MELKEVNANFGRLLMLNSRKSELVLGISELNAKLTAGTMLYEHLLGQHWGPGHESAHKIDQENKQLEEELSPLRAEYATVCNQIDQIVHEMKSKGYDLTA